MPTAGLLVKSFRNRTSPAIRIALIALAVAVSAEGVPANPPSVTYGAPSTSFDTHDDNCNYGNYSGAGSMAGSVVFAGAGLTLSGNDTVQGFGANGVCHLTMSWQGTGSGSFSGTTTVTPNFTLTVPADVSITCMLTVSIDGIQESQFNCVEASPGGTYSLPAQTVPVPATLSSYLVQLYIVATWSNTATSPFSTFSVNVPAVTSIDILTQAGALPSTPAPPTLVLALTGILFLSLIGFGMMPRKSAGGGFPKSYR